MGDEWSEGAGGDVGRGVTPPRPRLVRLDAGHEVTGDVDALGLVIREAVDRARRAARA